MFWVAITVLGIVVGYVVIQVWLGHFIAGLFKGWHL